MALKQEDRWAARPRLAGALKLVIYLAPVVASAVVAHLVQRWLRGAYPDLPVVVAMLIALPPAILTLVGGERLTRRFLPLSMLLKLSLLFPDQVPNRLGIALRAASPKRLANKVASKDLGEAMVAETVLSLAAALNAHDRRTRGHSERVRALTMLVADELEISGPDRDKLEWASLLHDLGKLNVSPAILNKKGRPDEAEWEELRQHPAGGPAIAGALGDWLGEWIHAMDQHHEKFDGSGYPHGLTADGIAFSGRIVAVTDAFEVMTATRSYKQPMSTQAARSELVACAGAHFDPVVTRAFMDISIAQLHRALGPASWLASLPFANLIGSTARLGGSIVGGSAAPVLAAAVALVLATSGFDGAASASETELGAQALAGSETVSVEREVPADVADARSSDPGSALGAAGSSVGDSTAGGGLDLGVADSGLTEAEAAASSIPSLPGITGLPGQGSTGPTIPTTGPQLPTTSTLPPISPLDPAIGDGLVGETLTDTGTAVVDVVSDLADSVTGSDGVVDGVTDLLDDTTETVTDVVSDLTGDSLAPVTDVVDDTVGAVTQVADDVVADVGDEAVQTVTEVSEVLGDTGAVVDEVVAPVEILETVGGSLGGLLG